MAPYTMNGTGSRVSQHDDYTVRQVPWYTDAISRVRTGWHGKGRHTTGSCRTQRTHGQPPLRHTPRQSTPGTGTSDPEQHTTGRRQTSRDPRRERAHRKLRDHVPRRRLHSPPTSARCHHPGHRTTAPHSVVGHRTRCMRPPERLRHTGTVSCPGGTGTRHLATTHTPQTRHTTHTRTPSATHHRNHHHHHPYGFPSSARCVRAPCGALRGYKRTGTGYRQRGHVYIDRLAHVPEWDQCAIPLHVCRKLPERVKTVGSGSDPQQGEVHGFP